MKAFFLLFIVSLGAFGQELSFRSRLPKVQQLKNPQYSANDIKAEIDFGKGLVARILTKYPLVNHPSLQKYVNSLGAGLAAQIGRPELNFYFGVINTPDVNAYACPGGFVVLTKGLIDLLENEAELVGVLAHEIAHVNERHVIKKLKLKGSDDSAISGLGAMVGGATNSFRVALKTISDEAMNVLFNEGLAVSEELESDLTAINAVNAAGYRVHAYHDLLMKIKKSMEEQNAKVLTKTHPQVSSRILMVDKFEKKYKPNNQKLNVERFKRYATN